MSALTLLILRLIFLAVLWALVFGVVYALRTDLFGQRTRKAPPAPAPTPFPVAAQPAAPVAPARAPARAPVKPPTPATPATGPARRLVITAGPKAGLEIDLPSEQLAIGRSSESGLVIRDDYTSTHHARLMLWNDGWVVQDLDSTNGTFLDGTRVTLPTPVPLNTPVTIGQTTFELRR
jgi:pSer/pThr/pTyr-binding forkhead associated (FHA) protein